MRGQMLSQQSEIHIYIYISHTFVLGMRNVICF